MNYSMIGKIIKEQRVKKNLTQTELAEMIGISDKTISKWETGKGLPDISLIETLSKALGVSMIELMNGECIFNKNRSSNMLHSRFNVCPMCGNIIHTMGESLVSCCGITLPHQEAELEDSHHQINCQMIENEYFVTVNHPMSKEHYISFIAYLTSDRCELVKLYPEQSIEVRFLKRGRGILYVYCNQDGLFKKLV